MYVQTVAMIENFNQYLLSTQKGWTNTSAMSYMPVHMKLDLLSYLTRAIFLNMPLIQTTGSGFLDRLTLVLDLQTYSPGDVLAREKEPMDKCIIILQGDVSEFGTDGEMGRVYGVGQCIGEEILQEVTPCKATLVAMSFLTVAILTKRTFEATVGLFPRVAKHVKHERDLLAVKRDWFQKSTDGVDADAIKGLVGAQTQQVDAETLMRNMKKKRELEEKANAKKFNLILHADSIRRPVWIALSTVCFIYRSRSVCIFLMILMILMVLMVLMVLRSLSRALCTCNPCAV